MYLFSARPEVAKIAAAGRAASLPFERFGDDAGSKQLSLIHISTGASRSASGATSRRW